MSGLPSPPTGAGDAVTAAHSAGSLSQCLSSPIDPLVENPPTAIAATALFTASAVIASRPTLATNYSAAIAAAAVAAEPAGYAAASSLADTFAAPAVVSLPEPAVPAVCSKPALGTVTSEPSTTHAAE